MPALRKGQYSNEGCSGDFAFKRRYVDANTDSYVLVAMSGDASFTGILNGRYVDAVTGDVQNVTDGTLKVSLSGKGNLRVYVLDTEKTKAPGKVGEDGKYLYGTASVDQPWEEWPDETMPEETWTVKPGGSSGVVGGDREEPETPVEPSMSEGEQAIFFEHDSWNPVTAWVWSVGGVNYTGGNWPGENMTYLGNNVYKWTYTGDYKIADGSLIIFSHAGADQVTKDGFKFVNGGYYNANGYVKTIEGAGEIVDPEPPTPPVVGGEGTYTVYFNNTAGWNTVNAWVWDENNGDKNYTGGSWPGQSLSMDPATGYYVFSCTVTDANPKMMIIFNNGSSQTVSLDLINNGIYTSTGYTGQQVTTGVMNVSDNSDLKVWTAAGKVYIETPDVCTVMAASADGRTQMLNLHVGRNEVELPHGFYIIAGKKIIL